MTNLHSFLNDHNTFSKHGTCEKEKEVGITELIVTIIIIIIIMKAPW